MLPTNDNIDQWLSESFSDPIITNEIDDDGDEAEVEETFPPPKIKTADFIESMNKCIQWAEENDIPIENIFVLK